jgi:hypothetical protein
MKRFEKLAEDIQTDRLASAYTGAGGKAPRGGLAPETPPGAIDFGIIGNKSQLGIRTPTSLASVSGASTGAGGNAPRGSIESRGAENPLSLGERIARTPYGRAYAEAMQGRKGSEDIAAREAALAKELGRYVNEGSPLFGSFYMQSDAERAQAAQVAEFMTPNLRREIATNPAVYQEFMDNPVAAAAKYKGGLPKPAAATPSAAESALVRTGYGTPPAVSGLAALGDQGAYDKLVGDISAFAPPAPAGGMTAPGAEQVAPVAAATQTPAPEVAATAAPAEKPAAMKLEDFIAKREEYMGARPEPTYLTDLAANMEKQKKQDMWATLAQLGANIAAGQSPNFLTNVGAGLASAVPSAQKSLAERRALEREIAKAQYGEETAKRAERGETYTAATKQLSDQERLALERDQLAQEMARAELSAKTQREVARMYANARGAGAATTKESDMKYIALFEFVQKQHPDWTQEQIAAEAERLTQLSAAKGSTSNNLDLLRNKNQGASAAQRQADSIVGYSG